MELYFKNHSESLKDFDYVIRVLNSSTTREHLESSERLFCNFKNKWRYRIDSFDMIEFYYEFSSHFKDLKSQDKFKDI